jgi:hypothetical protein
VTEAYLRLWRCRNGHIVADQGDPPLEKETRPCLTCDQLLQAEKAVPLEERWTLEDLEGILSQAQTLGVL